MRKITLNFNKPMARRQIHEQIAAAFGFPEWYGKNLDALYDCLTSITDDTCVGIYEASWRTDPYLPKVIRVFRDAEEENPHLAVFLMGYR